MTVVDGVETRARSQVPSAIRRSTWVSRYVRALVAVDLMCALVAGVVGFTARFGGSGFTPIADIMLAVGLPLAWVPWVAGAGGYDSRFFGAGSDEYRRILNAGISLTAAVAIVSYATKAEVARGYVVVALPLLTGLDMFVRYRLRKRLHKLRDEGSAMRRIVLAGYRSAAGEMIRELSRTPYHGMRVVAVCSPLSPSAREPMVEGVPVVGGLDAVVEAVGRCQADAVAVLSCPELDGIALRRLAWELEKTETEIFVAPTLMDVAGPRTTIRPIAGFPLLHVDHAELTGPKRLVKAVFDKTVATVALVLLSPLMLTVAFLVRRTDPGPALFKQTRVGLDGGEFRMIKFRTMVTNAEEIKAQLADQNHGDGVLFKMKRDPRVTRIGHWLRRYSIDELPQLINVLRGDMSLIGPRPPLPAEVAQYGEDVFRRLVVKPGLTGLWQVSGRSDLAWDEAVRLDLQYVENWSLALDMQILWKTVAAVRSGSGAY